MTASEQSSPRQLRLWASACSHVGTDLKHGRESLADAIRHADDLGWEVALCLGDFSGEQGHPEDPEGEEVVRQLQASRRHRREEIYTIAGNHDATRGDAGVQWWFRKWVDPTGENTVFSRVDRSRMPYPIEGTWERYSFRVGNVLFLMMSDRNDFDPPVGRGKVGGYPSGVVTGETFAWWREMVEANPDAVIVSVHHYMLKDTTVASGAWEGFRRGPGAELVRHYHNLIPDSAPEGASYLYWCDTTPDAQVFERYLAERPGSVDLWLGAHTHTVPDDTTGGKSHVERKWDVTFVNVSALTQHHGRNRMAPMSRLFTFTEGSAEVLIECYLHNNSFAPQGWYRPAERRARLGKPFSFETRATKAA